MINKYNATLDRQTFCDNDQPQSISNAIDSTDGSIQLDNLAIALSPAGIPQELVERVLDFLPLIEVSRSRSLNSYFNGIGDHVITTKLRRLGHDLTRREDLQNKVVEFKSECEAIRIDIIERTTESTENFARDDVFSSQSFKFVPLARQNRHIPRIKAGLSKIQIASLVYKPVMIRNNLAGMVPRENRAVGINLNQVGLQYDVPVRQYMAELQQWRDSIRQDEYPSRIYSDLRKQIEIMLTKAQDAAAENKDTMAVSFVPILSSRCNEETLYTQFMRDIEEPLGERYGIHLKRIDAVKGPLAAIDLTETKLSFSMSPRAYNMAVEHTVDSIEEHFESESDRLKTGI